MLLVRMLLVMMPLGQAITAPVMRMVMELVLEAVLWVVQAR
jgi:hypothetical protein